MASLGKMRERDDSDNLKVAKKHRKVKFAEETGLDPNECIKLHLVSSAQEMEARDLDSAAQGFSPDFTERFFGEDGKIYGYKDLKIDIWLHALSFDVYIDIHYSETLQGESEGKRTKDLHQIFKEIFGAGLIEDRQTFIQNISVNSERVENLLHQHGEKVAYWEALKSGEGEAQMAEEVASINETLRIDLHDSQIKQWHSRLMPLVLMFIEAGKAIEQDDPRWEVFVSLEKVSDTQAKSFWKVVGFCTVYKFYYYPESTRLRISQILVLPPYQGKGYGRRLLASVNTTAVQREAYDVTMEEPSESLQELRDCMDVSRLLSFEPATLAVASAAAKLAAEDGDNASNGGPSSSACKKEKKGKQHHPLLFSARVADQVRQHLKINRMQLQRCWDVLLFLKLRGCPKGAQDAFRNLVSLRLRAELFGKSSAKPGPGNKLVVDTDNEYDSSKTFVMTRMKEKDLGSSSGSGSHPEGPSTEEPSAVETDEKVDPESELNELLEERLEEIERVAERVLRT